MNTTYIGQVRVIQLGGRIYRITEVSQDAAANHEWASKILEQRGQVWPNGRWSHEVANEVMEKAEDILLDYMLVTA